MSATTIRNQANRAHAQHSTGPRTEAGKIASASNALAHGLTAQRLILPGEDESAFTQLLGALVEDLKPENSTEFLLIEEMAQARLRLERARRRQDAALADSACDLKLLALLHRYATGYERSFYKALDSLNQLQKQRKQEEKDSYDFRSSRRAAASVAAKRHTPAVPDTTFDNDLDDDDEDDNSPLPELDFGFVSQNDDITTSPAARKPAA